MSDMPHFADMRDGGNLPPVSFAMKAMTALDQLTAWIAGVAVVGFLASLVWRYFA